jgi:hypothetical protein
MSRKLEEEWIWALRRIVQRAYAFILAFSWQATVTPHPQSCFDKRIDLYN